VEDEKQGKSDEDETKHTCHDIVDKHRDLEVERFFAVFVDLWRIGTLGQPHNQRSEDVKGPRNYKSEQRARVAEHAPGPDI
jgi:hypothetical protein